MTKKEKLKEVLNTLLYGDITDISHREYRNIHFVGEYQVDLNYMDINEAKFNLLVQALSDFLIDEET